jgi:prepilin-type N-terminal cleavage/methylation domain-containing protein
MRIFRCRKNRLLPWPRLLGGQRGMTLIELLVSSIIGLIVVASAFELYLTQHRGWLIQDEISDAQQAARASIRMLSGHIRMAGFGLPEQIGPLVAHDANPDTLMVIYQPPGHCEAPIEWDMPQPSAELRCDGHDISCFEQNRWAYIYDPTADTGEFFVITEVQAAAAHIQHNTTVLSRCYPKGSQVFMIEAYRFYIDQSDSLHPVLMVEEMGEPAAPFAENIENLQFRFVMLNGDTLNIPNQPGLVRQVLVDLTARTNREDLQFQDEYRRREFATKVQVRNLGF